MVCRPTPDWPTSNGLSAGYGVGLALILVNAPPAASWFNRLIAMLEN
jgi:hypothetical protein